MTIKRRQFLQMAGLSCVASPLGHVLADTATAADLQLIAIRDNQALPLFVEGDLLLIDAQEMCYSGDGIYLYPAWGMPRPYLVHLVTPNNQILEFRNPGSQKLLWTQSFALDNQFAGKLREHFPRSHAASKTGPYALLKLPALPASIDSPGFGFNIPGSV